VIPGLEYETLFIEIPLYSKFSSLRLPSNDQNAFIRDEDEFEVSIKHHIIMKIEKSIELNLLFI
jgi:hypothetical protein